MRWNSRQTLGTVQSASVAHGPSGLGHRDVGPRAVARRIVRGLPIKNGGDLVSSHLPAPLAMAPDHEASVLAATACGNGYHFPPPTLALRRSLWHPKGQ